MKGCVIIPTFNEEKTIAWLVCEIKKNHNLDVLVIDDGSTDKTASLARDSGAEVIINQKNRGKGFSLRTGFQRAIAKDYDFVITMDGDGQHHPSDLGSFIEHFKNSNSDIIVGNRMDNPEGMPLHRWFTNKIMSMVISSICKLYIPDTQCGFRLIKISVLRDLALTTENYEIESELLIKSSQKKYRIESIPIKTLYDGQESQINPLIDTMRFFKFILKDRMKEAWIVTKEFFSDAVIKYGSILILSSLGANIFNLFYWLVMMRRLHPLEFGVLNSMASFLMIIGIFSSILNTVLVRYFSEFKTLGQQREIAALFYGFLKRIMIINIVLLLSFIIFAKGMATFLNLKSNTYIYLSGLFLFFSNIGVLTFATMQGLQLFNQIALISFLQVVIKFISAVFLVFLGFRVLGAFLGFVFSAFFGFIFSVFQLPKEILNIKRRDYKLYKPRLNLGKIYEYFFPVAISLIAYSIFINTDVIFVRHYFSELETGIYSIVQSIGKIILFLPGSFITVFFPMSIHNNILNKNITPLLKKSLLFISLLCAGAVLITFLFPTFVLKILAGKVLGECVPLLRLIIFPMGLFSLNYILIFYNLSIRNTPFIISIFILAIAQIILLCIFHQNLKEVILVLMLISTIIFYFGIKSMEIRR